MDGLKITGAMLKIIKRDEARRIFSQEFGDGRGQMMANLLMDQVQSRDSDEMYALKELARQGWITSVLQGMSLDTVVLREDHVMGFGLCYRSLSMDKIMFFKDVVDAEVAVKFKYGSWAAPDSWALIEEPIFVEWHFPSSVYDWDKDEDVVNEKLMEYVIKVSGILGCGNDVLYTCYLEHEWLHPFIKEMKNNDHKKEHTSTD